MSQGLCLIFLCCSMIKDVELPLAPFQMFLSISLSWCVLLILSSNHSLHIPSKWDVFFHDKVFLCGSVGKKISAYNAGDAGSIPGLGRSSGEREGYPLQYSGLENSIDNTVHGLQIVRYDWVTFTLTFFHDKVNLAIWPSSCQWNRSTWKDMHNFHIIFLRAVYLLSTS